MFCCVLVDVATMLQALYELLIILVIIMILHSNCVASSGSGGVLIMTLKHLS